MEYLLICLVALIASGLTFLSGFGLGTILLPAFALFFPIDMAIAMTALVHFINNLFKMGLVGKFIDKSVALKFGLPAFFTSFLGATILVWLTGLQPVLTYTALGAEHQIMPIKLVVAILMLVFGFLEILPRFSAISFQPKFLFLGGALSGFFGGISGHQGALRSAFLVKLGLSKEAFIATGVLIACFVDITRIFVYGSHYTLDIIRGHFFLLLAAVLSAFLGATIGNRLLKKITMRGIQYIVSIFLIFIAVILGLGII